MIEALGTLGMAWAVAAAAMAVLWVVQLFTRNAGIVDVVWSFGTGIAAAWLALVADGHPGRGFLIAGLAGFWGLRLGLHLVQRVAGEEEDTRYREIRRRLGGRFQPWLFGFFQLQGLWIVLFALPMFLAARNPEPLGWPDALGVLIWIVSIVGEGVADAQLSRFRRDPANRGKVCREGLWRYSRHPNYFFEWIHWWAYVAIGLAGPQGWATLFGPLVMYLFLRRVTGIPPTEERLVESRGDAYREYQRTTNAFFPGPPKEAA
jgi:steroid 5-alpha reductase family enzyme